VDTYESGCGIECYRLEIETETRSETLYKAYEFVLGDDGIEQEELSLPSEVELPEDIDADDDDAINDYLSDIYGWLVIDWILSDKK
jgi:hypothetical protein